MAALSLEAASVHHWPLRPLLRAGRAAIIIGIAVLMSACDIPTLSSDEHWIEEAPGSCTCNGSTLDCEPKAEGQFSTNQRTLRAGPPLPPFENSVYCSNGFLGEAQDLGLCTCEGADLVCAYTVTGSVDEYQLQPPGSGSNFSQTFPDWGACNLDTGEITLEPTATPTELPTATATDEPTATASPTETAAATCQSGLVFVNGECVKACDSNADCGASEACSASGACVSSACGDGICGNDENTDLCSADCQCSDDGVCGQGEGSTCNDCLPTPGGGGTSGGGTTGGGDTGGSTDGGSCAPVETCNNMIDDDCNGLIDDGC